MSPLVKQNWLSEQGGATLGSDAFFPFRDSIDRAAQSATRYVVQPGGSLRDADVVAGMVVEPGGYLVLLAEGGQSGRAPEIDRCTE